MQAQGLTLTADVMRTGSYIAHRRKSSHDGRRKPQDDLGGDRKNFDYELDAAVGELAVRHLVKQSGIPVSFAPLHSENAADWKRPDVVLVDRVTVDVKCTRRNFLAVPERDLVAEKSDWYVAAQIVGERVVVFEPVHRTVLQSQPLQPGNNRPYRSVPLDGLKPLTVEGLFAWIAVILAEN